VCVGLGIFGGFAGGYWIGLPLTLLVPFLPVRFARYQGLGTPALIAYVIGVLLAVAWLMGNSFFIYSQPHWPPTPIIIACIILVILSALMVYAAFRRPYVRDRLPNSAAPVPQAGMNTYQA
jgi:peptidoglycan/LPS O-acetylase OafA/YrhL